MPKTPIISILVSVTNDDATRMTSATNYLIWILVFQYYYHSNCKLFYSIEYYEMR